ncbi:hypothetical protein ITP53_29520 [Nonomuraea sp. K274]|uniref:Uncharacterized protein n=1 Tax=Nonomuraea cypriaca TaxID=1187855 RepID=A0A931AIL8_9ACTN|nr:hypothetical protein [Nonomuraea cypriaca]MBF8189797.1 hypothetical protein [Nonomuraea cypriaca]
MRKDLLRLVDPHRLAMAEQPQDHYQARIEISPVGIDGGQGVGDIRPDLQRVLVAALIQERSRWADPGCQLVLVDVDQVAVQGDPPQALELRRIEQTEPGDGIAQLVRDWESVFGDLPRASGPLGEGHDQVICLGRAGRG